MDFKFDILKSNLYQMAELSLEQVFLLSDTMESSDLTLAKKLISQDDIIDKFEKENDALSQNVIINAALSTENEEAKITALRYALSAIRVNRHFEKIGDHMVNSAKALLNGNIRPNLFINDSDLNLILSRVVTIVGMTVESLVEEKTRFFGSVKTVETELDRHCSNFLNAILNEDRFSRKEFADLFRIVLNLERIGDLAVDVAMEILQLNTGRDIRHDHRTSKT